MKHDLRIGQKVYYRLTKYNGIKEIIESEIVKIGNKYFYVNGLHRSPVNIETLEHKNEQYSQSNFTIYLSKEEILKEDKILEMRRYIDYEARNNIYKLSIEDLTNIYNIYKKYEVQK